MPSRVRKGETSVGRGWLGQVRLAINALVVKRMVGWER